MADSPLQSRLRTLGQQGAAFVGAALTRVCGARSDGSFAIFTYHRVAPLFAGLPRPTFNVAPERFRQQVAGLQRRGYVIRPLSELLRLRQLGQPPPPRTVVLTFDDGFASVHRYAWPILQELQAPATMFLSTAFLDAAAPFPFDSWGLSYRQQAPADRWRPLTFAECREMQAGGLIEFGAHTHTHQDFRLLPRDMADDLRTCCDVLRAQLGLTEIGFAFPYGYFNEALLSVARQGGATCALTVAGRLNEPTSDPLGWGRFTAYDHDTAGMLAAKREGWYGWVVDRCKGCGRAVHKLAEALCRGRPTTS